jgi:hypothetical protein
MSTTSDLVPVVSTCAVLCRWTRQTLLLITFLLKTGGPRS